MNLCEEIIDFIQTREITGALLISGKWGCGKTYLIKEIAKELNDKKEYAIAIISLFGIDDVSSLVQRVKSEYLELSSTLLGKTTRKIGKGIVGFTQLSTEIAATAIPALNSLAAVNKGVGKMASVNIFDVLKIHNTVGFKNKRDFVLIFDDLERSKIEITDLLGAINEFCENKKIKTIIVANEEAIDKKSQKDDDILPVQGDHVDKQDNYTDKQEDKYKKLKEKVISRTLKLNIDYEKIVNGIVEAYQETERGYSKFLQKHKETLVLLFKNSKHDNIRSLKCAIANFERIYKVWQTNNFKTDYIDELFYSFVILTIEYKANNFQSDSDGTLNFIEKHTGSKYASENFRITRLDSIDNWIVYGIWDGEKIYNDFLTNTNPTSISAKQKFLHWSIYDLDEETTEAGLKEALADAYNGILPYDAVVSLLQRLQAYDELGISFGISVDYNKIDEGLNKQISAIKAGTFNYTISYNHVASADIESANDKTHRLLKKIEYMTESIYAWELRRKLLDFLKLPNGYIYGLNIPCLEEFDNEILDAFWEAYNNGNNGTKCDYLNYIVKINYCFPYRISIEKTQKTAVLNSTITNFKELQKRLSRQSTQEKDKITKLIENNHIEEIDTLIKSLESTMSEL